MSISVLGGIGRNLTSAEIYGKYKSINAQTFAHFRLLWPSAFVESKALPIQWLN